MRKEEGMTVGEWEESSDMEGRGGLFDKQGGQNRERRTCVFVWDLASAMVADGKGAAAAGTIPASRGERS